MGHLSACKTEVQLLSPLTYALLKRAGSAEAEDAFLDFVTQAAYAMRLPSVDYKVKQWILANRDRYAADPAAFEDAAAKTLPITEKPVILRPASSFCSQRAKYLIYPYLPRGMLSIVGGVSGTGKTSLMLSMAAAISTGSPLPFESQDARTPGSVIYLTMENDPNIILRPRLERMGADLDRCYLLNTAGVNMASAELEAAAKEIKPALMVFDPIQSFLPAGVQMSRAEQIRPVMDTLISLSKTLDVAIVLISHMSKPGPGVVSALDRLLGSSDFRNAARSVVIVGRDPENPEQRVFAHAKNSIGRPGPAQRYHIDEGGCVVFDGETDLTADQIIAQTENAAPRRAKAANALSAAIEDLDGLLGFVGWVDTAQVYTLTAAAGYSDRTMRYAKKALSLNTLRIGMQPNQKTYWYRDDLDEDSVRADILNQNEPLTMDETPTPAS